MDSLIKAKFSRRFIESGRVLSTLDLQKQRVMGRIENIHYIALYDSLQDKWALVRNANASYPCYSLDDKGNPLALYIDMMGNVRERIIKQDTLLDVLNNSEGSQEFREVMKATQEILKHKYSIEYIKPSLGYNMDIPHSCQKGKGHHFKWCDTIAKMVLLRDNKNNIIARCLIWDKENITHNGEKLRNDIADRLYGNEGIHKLALKNELKKQGIDCIWTEDTERPFEYGEYILKLPEQVEQKLDDTIDYREAPFLDTFSHYNESEGTLLSFHWCGRLDYNSFEWDGDTTKVLLDTNGGVYCEDDDDRVWDNYNGEYISQDDAVEPINYDGYVHRDSCIYSDYHDAYLVDDGDIIAVRTPGAYVDYDYTYVGSNVQLVEIDGEAYFLDSLRTYRA